jgi:Fe-S-cluster containining protein
VTREEIRAIADYLGRPDGKLERSEVRRVALRHSLTEKPNGDCIFLVRENGKTSCAIHEVRPQQCRTWPFWEGNLKTPHDWNTASKNCPGMGRGQHYSFEEIEAARLQK